MNAAAKTQATQLLREICDSIIESVKLAGPLGAPAGPMYAMLMGHGCTLEQFETIMGTLCKLGKLEKRGQCYHFVSA